MSTPTYTALATTTLSATVNSVSFTSINQNYGDLILVISGGTTSDGDADVRFNNDSGNNYSGVEMYGTGSSAVSVSVTGSNKVNPETGLTTGQNHWILQIMDYSATDKHKTVLTRNRQTIVNAKAYRWADTSAITKIEIFAGNTFTVGSTFSLYGIAK